MRALPWIAVTACVFSIFPIAAGAAGPAASAVDSPMRALKEHDRAVQSILDSTGGASLDAAVRQRIKNHINATFDFDELSKLSLGPHWGERSSVEQQHFVSVFSGIIQEQNFESFLRYYRESEITYQDEQIDSTVATVNALVPLKAEKVEITYHLHQSNGEWRVYDLLIDGSSTAAGHRRRHIRYIAKYSYERLVEQLEKQLARLTGGNG
jgi:phospholipid transport system substrate-binding protein